MTGQRVQWERLLMHSTMHHQIEQDRKLYLDEKFMNGVFNEIYTDQDGNDAPLPPLEEAMQYQYEVKQTPNTRWLKSIAI